jgi:tyrosine-protein kinase Etk/Wzc
VEGLFFVPTGRFPPNPSELLGMLVGVGYVALRHWMHKGVRGADDLEKLGASVFATINFSKSGYEARSGRHFLPILAVKNPDDLAVEGFRSLRTGLHFGMLDAKTRSLAITSSAPEAGKSFTSVNLAAVAAQSGQRVCLIDADLRRGTLRRYFGVVKNAPGLADVLAGQATLDAVLVKGPVEGLFFVPTGRFPPNPSELLMRPRLAELIAELDQRFDLTVLDSPPVLAVTDPVIIGRAVGANLAIVRHDVTPIAEVQAMMRTLENGGVRLTGVVLNGFDPRRAIGTDYSYGYRYDYGKAVD